MIRSVVKGSGSALPKRVVTNDELAQTVDTSDQWIRERTGIMQRHIAGEGETTSTLATAAARAALKDAGIEGRAIDLIVLATATPDRTFPATATLVQDALGSDGGHKRGAGKDVVDAFAEGAAREVAAAWAQILRNALDKAHSIGS